MHLDLHAYTCTHYTALPPLLPVSIVVIVHSIQSTEILCSLHVETFIFLHVQTSPLCHLCFVLFLSLLLFFDQK